MDWIETIGPNKSNKVYIELKLSDLIKVLIRLKLLDLISQIKYTLN